MSVATLRYEEAAGDAVPHAVTQLQRGHGQAEIAVARRGAQSALTHLYQRPPCRILFPRPENDDPLTAVLLTTSGGLAGGDTIRIAATAEGGASLLLTSQAAEKVYRSTGATTDVEVSLTVAQGAWLEWLPQEAILFDGARLHRRLAAGVAEGGRLLAAETLVFGRAAHGERLAGGLLQEAWRVRVGGRLAWADALRLDGDIAATLSAAATFAGAGALATAIYVGPDAADLLPTARSLAEEGASRGGASLAGAVLVARFLGAEARTVRRDLARFVAGMRHAAIGLPPRVPRAWLC
jgi:urease accessory protein